MKKFEQNAVTYKSSDHSIDINITGIGSKDIKYVIFKITTDSHKSGVSIVLILIFWYI